MSGFTACPAGVPCRHTHSRHTHTQPTSRLVTLYYKRVNSCTFSPLEWWTHHPSPKAFNGRSRQYQQDNIIVYLRFNSTLQGTRKSLKSTYSIFSTNSWFLKNIWCFIFHVLILQNAMRTRPLLWWSCPQTQHVVVDHVTKSIDIEINTAIIFALSPCFCQKNFIRFEQ